MNMSFKKTVIPLILAAIFTGCDAPHDHQSSGQIPASAASQDTNLARQYYDIAEKYLYTDASKAKEYYLKLHALSERLDWNKGRYLFAAAYTELLDREGLMDSSIVIHQKTLELAKMENNELVMAKILTNIGNCYNYKRWHETALKYYHDALVLFEKQDEKMYLAYLYDVLGVLHNNMDMYDEAIMYCEKALGILNAHPNPLKRISVLNNYAIALLGKQEFDKSERYLLEGEQLCLLTDNRYNLLDVYCNLSNVALNRYDLEKMNVYALKALELAKEFSVVEGLCFGYRQLGYVQMYRGNFNKSEEYTLEALKTAIEYDFSEGQMDCYTSLSEIHIARHDFRTYRHYSTKADSVKMASISEKTRLYAKEMEAKYETEKKELKISALEDERRLMMWLSMAGGATLLLALAVFLFLWLLTVQKKRLAEQQRQLAEQQVKQLEQEKQLVATQSLLDGETQERSRLARDLHDGLGSILTGTRLNLQEMKKEAVLNPMMLERYNTAFGLLDESIREMRRLAHHLMPEALSAFGLKQAAADFCRTIPHATFHYFGDETRFDPRKEIVMYRIMHELVNNALKHSGATHILVQIIRDADAVSLTVQDNGCGFDPATVSNGMGLSNIRTRVAAFSGNLMMDAKPGTGTEINVVIEI